LRPYGSGITFVFVIAALAVVAALLTLNSGLYGFFLRKRGLRFTLLAIPMHFFYYLYCGASFEVCWIQHRIP